jgi:anti-anti-sigma regulatory factor
MSSVATALPGLANANTPPRRFLKWLPVLAIPLVLVGAIVGVNYWLDPLTYSTSQQREVAAAWVKGQHVAMLDANVDLRELRREHVRLMTETPEIIVFGGSRFQEASSEVAPGKKFYNAFVSNDHFEDMLAFVQLLDENKRLPKTLVLSVRFSTFEFLGGREAWWWKSFAPEYIQMAKRLGIDTYSSFDTLSYQKYTHLFSAESAYERVQRYNTTKAVWAATTAPQDQLMDTIGPDGSLRFSNAYLKSATKESAREDVAHRLTIDRKAAPKLNEQLLGQMSKLLDFVKERGVRVVLIQTPYNPVFYEGIQGTEFLKSINRIEQAVQGLAQAKGIFMTGGFDPAAQGCVESDFRDFNHSGIDCMKKLFAKVPNL